MSTFGAIDLELDSSAEHTGPMRSAVMIRSTRTADVDFLWTMLFLAAHADEQPGATPESIRHDPDLVPYMTDVGRAGHLGVIATHDGAQVGAAWLRQLRSDDALLSTYVDEQTPELVIAVVPEMIGRGAGTMLLGSVLEAADEAGIPRVVLSVRSGNPALRLYQRHGFVEVDRFVNRVGTASVKMVRTQLA